MFTKMGKLFSYKPDQRRPAIDDKSLFFLPFYDEIIGLVNTGLHRQMDHDVRRYVFREFVEKELYFIGR